MFQHLRYFSSISILLITLLALGVGSIFKSMISEDLFTLVEKNNLALTQGFINSIWRPHEETINIITRLPSDQWPSNQDFRVMSQEAFRFFENMPVAKINVYLADSTLLFSSDQSKILYKKDVEHHTSTLFDTSKVLQGTPAHKVLHDAGFITPSGKKKKGVLVQTLAPIPVSSATPILIDNATGKANIPHTGMVEIFFDTTSAWNALGWFQWVSITGIIALFICLITALVFISRRSETIIGKQHELNLELAATAAAAEAESRNKALFLANISHELRTPLNAIIGFSQILEGELKGTLSEAHKTYIQDIHSSGTHLLSLINDILDYSKAEAGKLEMTVTETDLSKLIQNNMRVVFPRAEEAQITLAEDLPSTPIVLNTDSKKLKQALLNLLSNSVKFTAAGGEVRVSMWENLVDQTVSIEVRDTGIGIAQKNISKVLTPFGQAENNLDRKYEGTGLGLPLAKKFIEVMGGTFKIESEENVGTSITLTLPADKVTHGEETDTANSQAKNGTEETTPDMKDTHTGTSNEIII